MKFARSFPCVVLTVCLASGLPVRARQPEDKPVTEGSPISVEPKAFIAGEVVRLALMDLRAVKQPKPDDYQAALVLLGIARDLDPKNTAIIRRQIEAAFNAGDRDGVLEHTRALIREDTKDTVAQLRFISTSVTRDHQTAEARLSAYDRYVASTAIDPAVRSRLALDAALLARERGDEKGFNARLIQACQLDSTHKEAAALALAVYADRFPDDAVGRLDLQINLLKADPMDPNVYMSIARSLATSGAYKAAKQFHTSGMNILAIIGPISDDTMVESRVLKWYADGPASVVQSLAEAVAIEKDAAAREIKRLQTARKPIDSARKPEDVALSPQLMALSVMASDAAGDRPSVVAQMAELTKRAEKQIADLKETKTRGSLTEEQAAGSMMQVNLQLHTMRLWVDVDVEKVVQDAAGREAIRKNSAELGASLDAMIAVRSGKAKEALELCRDFPSVRFARIASGLAYEALGDKDRAIQVYKELQADEALQLAGAWAHGRLLALKVEEDRKGPEVFERLVADPRVPKWIHTMMIEPTSFVRVEARIPETADALTMAPIRVTLTNQSAIPLALGSDRALCSRFAMLPKLDGNVLESYKRPEIVDLDQRLRLMPQESVSMDVAPAPGQSGWVLGAQAGKALRVRWELVQGFIIDPAIGFRPGPMCQSIETESVLVRPLPDAMLTADQLAERIASSPSGSLARYIELSRVLAVQSLFADAELATERKVGRGKPPPAAAPAAASVKPLAQALATRFPTLSLPMRELIAIVVPHARLAPDMSVLDDAIKADPDPAIRVIALCTRVVDPADDVLKNAKTADDVRVRQVAAAVEARLASDAKVYARLSPDDFKPPVKPSGGETGK